MAKASTDMLIVDRCYNLVMWSCNHIENFPRSRRHTEFQSRRDDRL